MDNSFKTTAAYFRAHTDYFWQWAEKGTVIEWKDGQTICYREDLLPILEKLSPDGLPPFGAILLIMAACRDDWKAVAAGKQGLLYGLVQIIEYHERSNRPDMALRELVKTGNLLLDVIAALPADCRTGTHRTGLLYTLFKDEPDKLDPSSSRQCIDLFNRGILDGMIFKPGVFRPGQTFTREMESLAGVQRLFPDAPLLEMKVRTGVGNIPAPAELALKREGPESFLDELEKDDRLTGLIRLTRKLIAALNIPLHTHGSSDRLLGGVSDIANRGSFDRLLLSELANDDDTLMARLANNEALFLRREDLPSDPDRERILLIDTTLKMWGSPRVFALAVALACTCNVRPGMKTSAYVMGGDEWQEADMGSRQGIIKTLEKLDSALDCRASLYRFLNDRMQPAHPEIFLITEDACLHDIHFQAVLADGKMPMTACISVERSGQMRFYELSRGHRKMTSEARFELETLLHAPAAGVQRLHDGPAFLQQLSSPLFHPAHKLKFKREYCFMPVKKKIFCITLDRRLLFWDREYVGAKELVSVVPEGHQHWGSDEEGFVLLLVNGLRRLWLYMVNIKTYEVTVHEIPFTEDIILKVVFWRHRFYLHTANGTLFLDPSTGKALPGNAPDDIFSMEHPTVSPLAEIRKFVNNGYTVWTGIKSVFINKRGDLCLDTRFLKSFKGEDKLSFVTAAGRGHEGAIQFRKEDMPAWMSGVFFTFQRFVSKDGSEVVIDSRGFLHLRSSDRKVPEMTVVLIIDKPTAAWASDGQVCGPSYFVAVGSPENVERFYYHYIQRFIDVIQKNAAVHKI